MDTKTLGALSAALAIGATAGAGVTAAFVGEATLAPAVEQALEPDLVGEAVALVTLEQAQLDETAAVQVAVTAHRMALEAKHACECGGDCGAYADMDAAYHVALDGARFRVAVRGRKAVGP